MKALSIRQPWAWLILRPDLTDPARRALPHLLKDVENREWQPHNPGRQFRGEFFIHASSQMTRDDYEAACLFVAAISDQLPEPIAIPDPFELERGGIVGQAEIVDCIEDRAQSLGAAPRHLLRAEDSARSSPWFNGPVGLLLQHAQPLPFRLCKGRLGFFEATETKPPMHTD